MKSISAPEVSGLVKDILRNLEKDFRVEFRSRFSLNISIAFALIVTVCISLSSGGIPFTALVQSILLWVIIFFSAMNGLSHIFVREEDQATSLFLSISVPVDSIFLSKYIFNLLFMMVILTVIVPLFVFFLQVDIRHTGHFIISAVAGGMSIASATTILASMVAKAGGKGSLFTIISFPILLPVLWISIATTTMSLESKVAPGYGNVLFLLAFSGFMTALSFLLFRFIWLEK